MKRIVVAILTDAVLSALIAVAFIFAAPFLHEVIGSPRVHPGYLPSWLVLFTARQLTSLGHKDAQ